MNQNCIAALHDGTTQYFYGEIDENDQFTGNDTLAEPTFSYVGFTPAKEKPVCTAPAGLTATYGETLENVGLSNPAGNTPGTWTWENPSQKVGNVGTNTFKATFTPDDTNTYQTVTGVDVQVNVAAKATTFDVTVSPATGEYTGSAHAPKVTVKDGSTVLTESRDYTLSWTSDMTSVGEKTVTVTGAGNYEGSTGTATYQITKKNQAAVTISGADGKTYGDADFEITVSGGSGTGTYSLTAEPADVLTLTSKDGDTWTAHILKAGSVTLTANRTGDANYEDATQTQTQLTVAPKAVDGLTITLPDGFSATYTGSAFAPEVTVKDGTATLTKDTDYTVAYTNNVNAGTATVTVTGKGNYDSATSKSITFTINAKALEEGNFTIDTAAKDYTGQQITPSVSSSALTEADYDVAYGANINAGTGTITVTGKGNYTGKIEKTFTINKVAYTGEMETDLSVLSSKYDLNASTGYSLDLAPWIAAGGTAGTPTGTEAMVTAVSVEGTTLKVTVTPAVAGTTQEVTIPVTGCTNYNDYSITVTVKSVDKQPVTVTLDADTVTYDGQAHGLTPVWPTGDGTEATKTVTYAPAAGGESSAQAPKDAGTYTVTAIFEDDTYYGKKTATLTIEQLEAVLTWSGDTGLMYNGDAKNVTATVSNLVGDDSCTVTVTGGDAVDAGKHTATAESLSNSNYKLPAAKTHEYTIDPKVTDLTVTVSPAEFEYNGKVQQPKTITVKDGDTVLTVTDDYTVSMEQSQNVGTYTVTVTGAGNYAGSKGTATYEITKVSQATVVIGQIDAKTYGDADFTITVSGGSGEGAYSLTSSDPTILSLVKGEAAGEWTATIHKAGDVTLTAGKAEDDNYKPAAAVTMELEIQAKALNADEVTLEAEYNPTYTGEAFTPSVTVKDGDKTLVKDTDYEVAYKNNINAGTATVTVTGKGNYAGSVEKTFIINKASLSEMKPTIVGDAQVGGVLTAKLAGVAADQYTWTWYRDGAPIGGAAAASYVVTTDDSNKAITVQATAKADVNYSDATEISEAVTVAKQAITGTVVITETNGTGTAGTIDAGDTLTATATVTPAVTLGYQWFVDGQAVENATTATFTVPEDSADKSITVTVAPTSEDYTGSVTSAAVVVGKAPLTGSVTLSQSNGKITAAVEGAPEAENYDIVWLRDGQPISGATGNEYTVTDADKGHTISAKLVAKGDTYTGEIVAASGVAVAAEKPNAPVVTASAGNGQITVSWTAQDNGSPITQYQVQLDGGPVITVDANTTSYTFDDLTNGTEYTVTVKAINALGTGAVGSVKATPKAPSGGGGGGGVTTYATTVEKTENGTVTASPKNAAKGATVTLTVTPDEGYVLDTLTATDKDGNKIELTKVSDTKYTFKMPASAVTVKAAFSEKPDESKLPFTDVAENAWYYDAVVYVYENGMMTGTNDGTTFSPAMSLTRGMMAQVMFNLEKGTAPATGSFTDVAADAWYADAVNWAAANVIVGGYGNGKFGPEDSITREQMAVLLYNYAKFKGYDMTATTDLTAFSDDEKVSGWAEYAMKWAVAEGLINGSNNALNPLGTASRAEVAQILMNFGQNVAK